MLSRKLLPKGVSNAMKGIVCQCRSYSQKESLKKTCLYDYHVKNGGKMVPFAGWSMPVQYTNGISESHLHVRSAAGLFDVSHMLQTKVTGKDRVPFIESLIVGDIEGLKDNQGTLSIFTNEKGSILDDLIVSKTEEGYLYVVSNAGCADKDYKNMKTQAENCRKKGMDVNVEMICNGLLALQGPSMAKVLQEGVDFDLNTLPFMTNKMASVFGIPDCRVTRCGYTGEDGVEISVNPDRAEDLANTLTGSSKEQVMLIGLGARDTLRLEAGLCLYGSDIDETTTPVEASLTWTIGKRRREEANFPGASIILRQINEKPERRRVGFLSSGAPARGHTKIYDESGSELIGELTSGCPSPSLKQNVSMGYIKNSHIKTGTKVKFEVRKKRLDAVVSKMPFVPSNYFSPK
ncbi:aminomethyltransferase, mitochondrial-like [Saccostrea echinata]|uniref:aminomethyltransferase, mitochondrial-like n=1 Tax=Saccostrea echinata TaxID=191078 RepID=UPI002A7F616C|nr:aminomethyltransferase, mitochondrial-like [Saccostrea echinata]